MISASVGKGAGGTGNRKPDVRAIQCLLNLSANMVQSGRVTKLSISGTLDTATQDAIDLFQTKVMKIARPDGRVDARGSTIRRLANALGPLPSGPFTTPAWLAAASAEEGVKEIGGRPQNNPRILEYLATAAQLAKIDDTIAVKAPGGKTVRQKTGYKMGDIDETAWCACFVNWCLDQAGEERLKGAAAQAYRAWGKPTDQIGAVTVIKREPFNDSSSGFHVGFYVGGKPREGYVALLGGNQNNCVCRKWFVGIEPQNVWLRWPGSAS